MDHRLPVPASLTPARVACVWLPHFAVGMERARRPLAAGVPLALVGAGPRNEGVVRACSPEAVAAGLAVGMPAHAVPNRCRSALVLPFDAGYYQRCCEAVLEALDAVTPGVEAQPLETFYLDLTGLPHLERAEEVAAAVRSAVLPIFSPRVGVAPGKFTAWVAANRASPIRPVEVEAEERALFLEPAPSALLPVGPETARRLDLMGLRTLGQVARLPRSAMLAQFGWEGVRAHRLACGEDREVLRPYRPPLVLRESLAFPAAAPTEAHFYLALGRLLQHLCARPERGGRGIRQLRLEALLEAGDTWERTLTLRRPAERWEAIYAELKRRLETDRPVGVLMELSVELTALARHVEGQGRLFVDRRERRRELLKYELSQLRARFGKSRVYQIVEVEPWSRLPENRYALLNCEA